MKYPNFEEEKILWSQGLKYVAGLDEAGRGPLAGPVVAAAVIINSKFEYRNSKQIQINKTKNQKRVSDFVLRISDLKIMDSKQLSQKQREHLFKILTRHPCVSWGVGIVSEKIIDKINILEATKLAMAKAVYNLSNKISHHNLDDRPDYDAVVEQGNIDFLLIDGNFKIYCATPFSGVEARLACRQKSIINGDQKVFSISAASIIAKVTRDRLMQKMHKKYPQYGFDKHKGYGTALHFAMLKKHGACPIHRKTFFPVSASGVMHT